MSTNKSQLSQKERQKKEDDYRERHRFWAEKVLTQFGFANNFFIAIGLAMLGYFLNHLDHNGDTALLIISAITTALSLVCGCFTVLSRLYDLRLTRHINTLRIQGVKGKKKVDGDDKVYKLFRDRYIDIRSGKNDIQFAGVLFCNFFDTMFKKRSKYFIKYEDIFSQEANKRFLSLRARTLMLSSFSWMCFSWQIFWLLPGIVLYIIIWSKQIC